MNELKYCKFCDKEKPVKDFCKSGFAIKNICRECQNQKQTQIYRNSKKVEELQQENKQLNDNWNKLKEIIKSQSGFKKRADLKGGLWFEIDELLDKMQELEQGSDSNE